MVYVDVKPHVSLSTDDGVHRGRLVVVPVVRSLKTNRHSLCCSLMTFRHNSCWSLMTFRHNCPRRLTFTWWECCGLCFWHKPTGLAHSVLFCSCVYFCLYSPLNSISFHKVSRQLSAFSLCSSGLISALLVLSTNYLFMKVSFSPDIILCGWLGLRHQVTN